MQKTVYVADQLKKHGFSKPVYEKIKFHLGDEKYGYHIKELENVNKNIWCRDYMPVRNCKSNLVKFHYNPSYTHLPVTNSVCEQIDEYVIDSPIILDGGSIEVFGESVIVSDRIFRNNYETWSQDERGLLTKLKDTMEAKELIVVPQHPYDFTGHVDGMVRFVDESRVLINDLTLEFEAMRIDENDYRKKLIEQWYYAFKMAMYNAGLKCYELLCTLDPADPNYNPSDAFGIYMNFLLLDDLILVPGFNIKKDEVAKNTLKKIYKREAITIQAKELAKKGGIINCVTWQS